MFEEFRMLSFINNIKIQTPNDGALRSLSAEERELIMPLFFRKSIIKKKQFVFEDIAKKLARREQYGFYKKSTDVEMPYLFNFPMDTSVSGCPVTAALIDIFAENWVDTLCETYTLAEGKSRLDIVNDIWHVLFFYTDEAKLAEFGKNRLQLNDEDAKKFSKITLQNGYGRLCLKVICKILPYLRRGLVKDHAIFLGNLCEVMPQYEWDIKEMRIAAIDNIIREINKTDSKDESTLEKRTKLEKRIKEYLKNQYHVSDDKLKKLYHPSKMDKYPRVLRTNDHGVYQLGSPRIDSVRNPMAMRSIFRLRKLVNRLLEEGKIDLDTEIHIEFARELNDANKRHAIAEFAKINQKKNDEARKKIIDKMGEKYNVKDDDILKCILWEEQGHICLYTGRQIAIPDFVGTSQKFDIEHTIPRSVDGDSTRMNLTLCDSRFNREIKKTKLPAELPNHDEIMARINDWREKYESLDGQIRKLRGKSKGATTKKLKDDIIYNRHLLELQRNYWRGKYLRFTMEIVPEGFSRRQGTDIGVISKYARLYLKSLFKHVYTVNGIATSDFRKIWGVQDVYGKKERVNHVHHCIDAIVVACISRDEYNKLSAYYHDEENHKWYGMSKAYFKKPWPTFVEDLKNVQDEILVYHYTPDNMPKQGRRKILLDVEVDGIKKKKKVLCKGDAARGSLHSDTYYGAIENDGVVRYVKRINLASMKVTDVKNIVDDAVRGIVEAAIREKGFKEAMAGTIWMNEEKQIPIKKVRCYTSIKNPISFDKKKQRDLSDKEYKRNYYVTTKGNYIVALYVGSTKTGKRKTFYEFVNMMEAAGYYKTSNDKSVVGHNIMPLEKDDCQLAFILKKGTMIIFYKETKEEVWDYSQKETVRNLYYVSKIESDGRVTFKYHQEARLDKELPRNASDTSDIKPKIRVGLASAKILVQGYDFDINELGEIKRLR